MTCIDNYIQHSFAFTSNYIVTDNVVENYLKDVVNVNGTRQKIFFISARLEN